MQHQLARIQAQQRANRQSHMQRPQGHTHNSNPQPHFNKPRSNEMGFTQPPGFYGGQPRNTPNQQRFNRQGNQPFNSHINKNRGVRNERYQGGSMQPRNYSGNGLEMQSNEFNQFQNQMGQAQKNVNQRGQKNMRRGRQDSQSQSINYHQQDNFTVPHMYNNQMPSNNWPSNNFPPQQFANQKNQGYRGYPPRNMKKNSGTFTNKRNRFEVENAHFTPHNQDHRNDQTRNQGFDKNSYRDYEQPRNYQQRSRGRGVSRGRGGVGVGRHRGRGRNESFADFQENHQYKAQKRQKFIDEQKQERMKKFNPLASKKKSIANRLLDKKSTPNNKQAQSYVDKAESSEISDHSSQEKDEGDDSPNYDEQQSYIYEEEDEYSEDLNEQDEDYQKDVVGHVEQQIYSESKLTNQMCPKDEFQDRLSTFNMNNPQLHKLTKEQLKKHKLVLDTSRSFTIFEIDKRTYQPEFNLTLKRFKRSADRQGENNVGIRRSINALVKVINHIKDKVIDSDRVKATDLVFPLPSQKKIQFIQIYDFLWDRMREMVKDITRLNEEQKKTKQVISICEQITRFFILAMNEGRKQYKSQLKYDQKMNRESLTKIMTPLMDLYVSARIQLKRLINQLKKKYPDLTLEMVKKTMQQQGIYISPNQPEMTAYAIIFSNDFSKYLYENISVGFNPNDYNPLFNSDEIKKALEIQTSLLNKNFEKYYEILESPTTDYVMSSLILSKIQNVREQSLAFLTEAQRYFDSEAKKVVHGIQSSLLQQLLHFNRDQFDHYQQFLKYNGYAINQAGYVTRFGSKDEAYIYKTPVYNFEINKTARSLYNNASPPQKVSKVIDSNSEITRRQLVQRSWSKSNYLNELICTHLKIEAPVFEIDLVEEQEQMQLEQNGQKIKLSSRKQTEKQKNGTDKLAELRRKALEKKKGQSNKENHEKFLNQLVDLLVDLFTPDEIRQQKQMNGFAKLFNLETRKKYEYYMHVFNQLGKLVEKQLDDEENLQAMHHFTQNLHRFQSGYQERRDLFTERKIDKGTSCGISKLLQKKKEPISAEKQCIAEKIFVTAIRQQKKKPPESEFVIKIITDLSQDDLKPEKQPLSNKIPTQKDRIINIIKNIISEIIKTPPSKVQLTPPYAVNYKQLTLKIQVVAGLNSTAHWPKLLGSSCFLYVGRSKISQSFVSIIREFIRINQEMKSTNDIPILVLKFITASEPHIQESNNLYAKQCQLKQFLFSSQISLSSKLKSILSNFVVRCFKNRKISQVIEVRSLGELMGQIGKNSQYVQQMIKGGEFENQQFMVYTQYLSLCIEQLCVLNNSFYEHFLDFRNWGEILEAIQSIQPQIKLKWLKEIMKQSRQNLNIVFERLKIPNANQKIDSLITISQIKKISFEYLQRFDWESPNNDHSSQKQKELQQYTMQMSLKPNQIKGFYRVFEYIMSKQQEYLQLFYIIVPQGFRFNLSFTKLLSNVKQKLRSQNQQRQMANPSRKFFKIIDSCNQSDRIKNYDIEDPREITGVPISEAKSEECVDLQSQESVKKRFLSNHQTFNYHRLQWLESVKKKLKKD